MIFNVGLTLFKMMQKQILETDDTGEIYMIVNQFGH